MRTVAAAIDPQGRLPTIAVAVLGALTAVAFGTLVPTAPEAAIVLVALVPLALFAPVASLAVVLFLTAIVPFDVQNRLAVSGGEGVPGLLAVDVLVLVGLSRVAALVLLRRLQPAVPLLLAAGLALVFAIALVEGVARGADASDAGTEGRRLFFGVAAFMLAWPIVGDERRQRRLLGVLLALGLALGLWGLTQWFFGVDYSESGDVGVRPGVDLTSGGRGQLQGGLYAFPVAVTLSFAALLLHRFEAAALRRLVAAVLVLNVVCLVLTYERTFWAATVLSCALVALWGGRDALRRVIRWLPVGVVALLVAVAASGPGEIRTAAQRLTSVTKYRADSAVEYRKSESTAVAHAIKERPLTGSGLGATITWGETGVFATTTTPFSHVGYLWLAWKLGLPAAVMVVLALGAAAASRRRSPDHWLGVLSSASRAALVGVLLISVTFPAFNALGATAVIGVLAAMAVRPASRA